MSGLPTIPCPSCREFIHPRAELCPLCGADVRAGAFPPEQVDAMRARIAELTAAAGDPPPPQDDVPGSLRVSTVVFLVLFASSFLPAFLIPKDGWIFPFMGFIFFGIAALALGIGDLVFPSPRKRATAEAGVRCFYKGIQQRRWKACWAALSPAGRGRHVIVPSIPDMNVVSDDVDLTDAKAIKSYWKRLVLPSPSPFGTGRRILKISVEPQAQIAPNLARVRVDLLVEHYPTWVFFFVLIGALLAVILYAVLRRQRTSPSTCWRSSTGHSGTS